MFAACGAAFDRPASDASLLYHPQSAAPKYFAGSILFPADRTIRVSRRNLSLTPEPIRCRPLKLQNASVKMGETSVRIPAIQFRCRAANNALTFPAGSDALRKAIASRRSAGVAILSRSAGATPPERQ